MNPQAKHTPGYWTMAKDGELTDRPFTVGKLFYCVADVGNEADARLIASAPDLLEALKEFTLRFEALEEKEAKGQNLNWREITANGAYDAAKRAIAKATGGNTQ